jgi:ABC-type multidrug transport system ATPase subunit
LDTATVNGLRGWVDAEKVHETVGCVPGAIGVPDAMTGSEFSRISWRLPMHDAKSANRSCRRMGSSSTTLQVPPVR